jgi:antitoxin component of MazEF toxin-antitoxin module
MTATLSSNGKVALPQAALEKLGLRPGAELECQIENGQIVLTPKISVQGKARVGISEISGMPAIIAPEGSPPLTPELVKQALADFP